MVIRLPFLKRKKLAFVLAGGGSRGALQAGALRALVEAGYQPDILVGTSIGAINGAFLALHGVNSAGIKGLFQTWREASNLDLLPANYLWLTVRTLFNRTAAGTPNRLRNFMVEHGLTPDLKFSELPGPPLFVVAADMNSHAPVVYGVNPDDTVLEGVVASATLPPWIPVLEKDGMLLIDGGVLSNLPIEAALSQGATEIIALSLQDNRTVAGEPQGFGSFLTKLIASVQSRTMQLELALAAERGVLVRCISLTGPEPVVIWNFTDTEALLERGYKQAKQAIQDWKKSSGVGGSLLRWRAWMSRLFSGPQPNGPKEDVP